MKSFNILAVLSFGALSPVLATPSQAQDNGQPQCGISADSPGAYMFKGGLKSVQECLAFCKSYRKCSSVEYKYPSRICWLFEKPVSKLRQTKKAPGTYVLYDRDCILPDQKPQCGVSGDGNKFYTSKKLNSMQECQIWCKNEAKCQSSEYKITTGLCWLFEASVAGAKETNEPPGTYVFNDKNCPVPVLPEVKDLQCGVPGDGSKYYTSQAVQRLQDCRDLCKNDTRCLSSEFKFSSKRCWLFDLPVEKAKDVDKAAGTNVFFDKDCECGVSGDGWDFYTLQVVQDIQACLALCESESKCRASEFRLSNNNCWLYA